MNPVSPFADALRRRHLKGRRGTATRSLCLCLCAVTAIIDLAPVLVILLASALGLFAATHYAERRSAIRAVETERYLEQFEQGPVAQAWQRLGQSSQAARADADTLADRSPGSSGSALRVRTAVLEVALATDVAADVDVVVQYFKRLALCVRMGSCDPAMTAARLGDRLWRFRDRYHWILQEAYLNEPFERYFAAVAPRTGAAPSRPTLLP
jgi:hypothetical protein